MFCSLNWFATQRPKEDLHTHANYVTLQDATMNEICVANDWKNHETKWEDVVTTNPKASEKQ